MSDQEHRLNPVASFQIPDTYKLYKMTEEDAERHYCYLKNFWINRGAAMGAAREKEIVEQYRSRNLDHDRRLPAENIAKLAAPVIASGKPFRVLELGCANAPLLWTLGELNAMHGIEFIGVEPFKPFVDDFNEHFPNHLIFHADAEAFADMTADDFPELPISIFYTSVALCMLSPTLTRACLAFAADICEEIILYDYVLNGLGPIDETEPIIFEFSAENSQWYFAHNYPAYFAEIGFEVASGISMAHPDGKEGYALLRAVRKV